jgi:23S rRNA pseudouridine1911/1915/1917 synthase
VTTLRRFTVQQPEPLLVCLLASLKLKRKDIKNLLKVGAVAVNGTSVCQFDHPLKPGDDVVVSDLQSAVAAGDLKRARIQIVFEDEAIVVLDKPVGLLTVATANEKTDTLYCRLNRYLQGPHGAARAHVVHRLDQETSGLVLFAKSESVRSRLQDDWPAVEKLYQAAVIGLPNPVQGTIATYLTETTALQVFSNDHESPGSRLARTHYRLLRGGDPFSLLEVRLATGRKHQIRVHMAGLGCPIAGDRRYGAKVDPCDRLALHAVSLAFAHPISGQHMRCESPLPAVIRALVPRTERRVEQSPKNGKSRRGEYP